MEMFINKVSFDFENNKDKVYNTLYKDDNYIYVTLDHKISLKCQFVLN